MPIAGGVAHRGRRFDRDHFVPAIGKPGGIATAAGSDVKHTPRRLGQEVENLRMHVLEPQAFVVVDESGSVALVTRNDIGNAERVPITRRTRSVAARVRRAVLLVDRHWETLVFDSAHTSRLLAAYSVKNA